MTRTCTRTMLAVLLLFSFSVLTALAQKPLETADSAAIRQVVTDFTDAYNRHDARACAMYLTEGTDFINVQDVIIHGQKPVEDHWPPLFNGRLKNAHRTVAVRDVRFLSPEIATMDADWEQTGSQLVDGGPVIPLRKGFYDWVLTKQNGRWLVAVLHESELPVPVAK